MTFLEKKPSKTKWAKASPIHRIPLILINPNPLLNKSQYNSQKNPKDSSRVRSRINSSSMEHIWFKAVNHFKASLTKPFRINTCRDFHSNNKPKTSSTQEPRRPRTHSEVCHNNSSSTRNSQISFRPSTRCRTSSQLKLLLSRTKATTPSPNRLSKNNLSP